MSDLINTLTPQIGYTGNELTPTGNINGFLDIIVYAHNYNDLDNKPSINNVTLTGNKTPSELGLAVPADITVNSVNSKTGDVVLDGTDIQYISGGDTVYAKIVQLENEIAQSGVLSVNGETGIVILDGSDIEYSSGVSINQKINAVESEIPTVDYPVTSVNGETGAVVLDGNDIEYSSGVSLKDKIDAVEGEIPVVDYPVTSVNSKTGAVSLTAGDIALGSDFTDPTSTAGSIGDLTTLMTTDKSSIVGAVNEVNAKTLSTNTTVDIGTYGDDIQLCKTGKVVLMIINPLSSLPSGGWTQIGTLPSGYEPIIQTISDMYSRDDRHLRIRLDTDRKIYVYNYSSVISSSNNAYWNVTYITA